MLAAKAGAASKWCEPTRAAQAAESAHVAVISRWSSPAGVERATQTAPCQRGAAAGAWCWCWAACGRASAVLPPPPPHPWVQGGSGREGFLLKVNAVSAALTVLLLRHWPLVSSQPCAVKACCAPSLAALNSSSKPVPPCPAHPPLPHTHSMASRRRLRVGVGRWPAMISWRRGACDLRYLSLMPGSSAATGASPTAFTFSPVMAAGKGAGAPVWQRQPAVQWGKN